MAELALAASAFAGSAGTAAAAGSTFATLATAAQIGGTILSGIGAIQSLRGGNAQASAINASAVQAAGQERARAQRVAAEQRRQATLVSSRARAVAGASGGGVTDPTVTNITAELAGEGEYRALSALYEGNDRANGIIDQGRADAYSAKSEGRSGFMKGMTSVLSSGSSLFDKFGGGGMAGVSRDLDDTIGSNPGLFGSSKTYQTPFGKKSFYS
jgi:hypothetical protein